MCINVEKKIQASFEKRGENYYCIETYQSRRNVKTSSSIDSVCLNWPDSNNLPTTIKK